MYASSRVENAKKVEMKRKKRKEEDANCCCFMLIINYRICQCLQ